MSFILDCSVTMTWCFKDQASDYAVQVLKSMKNTQAYVPFLWDLEVANVIHLAHKKKHCTEADQIYYIELLNSLNIKKLRVEASIEHLLLISREHNLTAYDACYFYLSMSHNMPIATLDIDLKKAVLKAGGKIYLQK